MCGTDFSGKESRYEVVDAETGAVLGTPHVWLLEDDEPNKGSQLMAHQAEDGTWAPGWSDSDKLVIIRPKS